MLNFVVGLFCGSIFGVIIMALMQINHDKE